MASITIEGIENLKHKLEQLKSAELKSTMVQATNVVHAQAKLLAPKDKGLLASSIHQEVNNTANGWVGKVFTNLQYAPYVEFGTGTKGNGTYPYKIKGFSLKYRDTKWVYSPDGGETFYYTSGQVAQPFMYPALKQNEKYIRKLISEGIENCLGGK